MTELNRRARDLVAANADGDRPTAAQRSRLRASLLARVGTGVALGSAGTAVGTKAAAAVVVAAEGAQAVAGLSATSSLGGAGGATFGALAAKVVSIAALTVGVGGGGYMVVSHFQAPPAVSVVAATPGANANVGTAPAREAPRVVPAEALPATRDVSLGSPRRGVTPPPSPSPFPPPSPPTPRVEAKAATSPSSAPSEVVGGQAPGAFESETRALRGALASLRDGQAEEALYALDTQDALYANGLLGEERAAARIDALCVLGRAGEARAAAARFLDTYPRSLLAARVRASCGVAPHF
jgi:hypothetical protein